MTWCLSRRVKNHIATLLNSEQYYRLHWVYCKLEVNVPLVPSWITQCTHKDIEALLRLHFTPVTKDTERGRGNQRKLPSLCWRFREVLSMVMESRLEETDATDDGLLEIGDERQATSSPPANQRGRSISSGLGTRWSDSDVWERTQILRYCDESTACGWPLSDVYSHTRVLHNPAESGSR